MDGAALRSGQAVAFFDGSLNQLTKWQAAGDDEFIARPVDSLNAAATACYLGIRRGFNQPPEYVAIDLVTFSPNRPIRWRQSG